MVGFAIGPEAGADRSIRRAAVDLGWLLVRGHTTCGERSPRRFAQRREPSADSSPYADDLKRVIFLGMNPGPFGMAQTGIPFGDVAAVRDWLGIEEPVGRPAIEHPKRPVRGFDCPRSEVSGSRLWGAIAEHYGRPEKFFEGRFITNYCPLVFIESSGRNRTPDKLPASEREPLFSCCDAHLQRLVEIFKPEWVIGIGAFAEQRAREALAKREVRTRAPTTTGREAPVQN